MNKLLQLVHRPERLHTVMFFAPDLNNLTRFQLDAIPTVKVY